MKSKRRRSQASRQVIERRGTGWLAKGILLAAMLSAALQARATERTWTGLESADWFVPANWKDGDNQPGVPDEGDTVFIGESASVLLTNQTAELAAFSITNATLIFSNWTTRLRATDVTIENNGKLTLPVAFTDAGPSNRIWVVCTNLDLEEGGIIDADSSGFNGDNGEGKGTFSSSRASGGGYGGIGGRNGGNPGFPYGSASQPLAPGSGGGTSSGYTTYKGMPGGGAVRIEAQGRVTVNGTITANGGTSTYVQGGGSGGGVYVSCNTFEGYGMISCSGGNGIAYTCAGGGGRIAIDYTSAQGEVWPVPSVRLLAAAGSGGASDIGTVWMPDGLLLRPVLTNITGSVVGISPWSPASILVSNNWIRFAEDGVEIDVAGSVTVAGASGRMELGGNAVTLTLGVHTDTVGIPILNIGGDLVLTNQGSLYVYSAITNNLRSAGAMIGVTNALGIAANSWLYPCSHPTNGGVAHFRAGTVQIASNGGINADARGYIRSSVAGSGFGPGKGLHIGSRSGGGGYGGRGGDGNLNSGQGGLPYGSTNAPADCGSSGASFGANGGGHGGGLVYLTTTGTVMLAGTIRANGANASNGGGGSGGGIFMACASLTGDGELHASGGNSSSTQYHGGGGGGRISVAIGFSADELANLLAEVEIPGLDIYSQEPTFDGNLFVTNGTGYASANPPAHGSKQFMKIVAADQQTVRIVGDPMSIGVPYPNGYADSWTFADGTVLTNTVASPADELDDMRWSCMGWRLTDTELGTPIANDTGTQAVFTVTNNVTLTWLWTNQYRLAVSSLEQGTVNAGTINGWYTNGVQVSGILATVTDPDYAFLGWVGNGVPAGQETANPLTVTMDRARTDITATYALIDGELKVWIGTGSWTDYANWDPPGMPGSNDSVVVQSGTLVLDSSRRIADLVVNNGATLVCSNWMTRLTVDGNMTVQSNGVITLPTVNAISQSSAQVSNRVWIVCKDLQLEQGALINADARGYSRSSSSQTSGFGEGKGLLINSRGGGGGYGGRGGDSENGIGLTGGAVHGETNAPAEFGSSGASYGTNGGGTGGGLIQLFIENELVLDGTISANGANASNGGGGSGGGIYLVCDELYGSATAILRANGGNSSSTQYHGGGGGGRIAVWVGVSEAARDLYLAGTTNAVIRDITNSAYLGNALINYGTGYENGHAGTAFFFTPKPITGSIFMFR